MQWILTTKRATCSGGSSNNTKLMDSGAKADVNWDLMWHSGRLEEMFQSENVCRMVTAHNKHECSGCIQYGGTFAMTFSELATRTCEMGSDKTGLGWWVSTLFKGQNGQWTRTISAYQPCHSRCNQLNTIYSQHLQYFQQKGKSICPREAVAQDLGEALRKWRVLESTWSCS